MTIHKGNKADHEILAYLQTTDSEALRSHLEALQPYDVIRMWVENLLDVAYEKPTDDKACVHDNTQMCTCWVQYANGVLCPFAEKPTPVGAKGYSKTDSGMYPGLD